MDDHKILWVISENEADRNFATDKYDQESLHNLRAIKVNQSHFTPLKTDMTEIFASQQASKT